MLVIRLGVFLFDFLFGWLLGIKKEGFNIRQGQAKRILGKGGMFQGTFNTIGQWIHERVYFLFSIQGFQLG